MVGVAVNAATSLIYLLLYGSTFFIVGVGYCSEADRMVNLKLDPVEIEREREVILQERRQGLENVVLNAGLEQLQAAAFCRYIT